MREKITFLGIETSCDETAAAVIRENENGTALPGRVHLVGPNGSASDTSVACEEAGYAPCWIDTDENGSFAFGKWIIHHRKNCSCVSGKWFVHRKNGKWFASLRNP